MNVKSDFAKDAATAGLIIGLIKFGFNAIAPIFNLDIESSSDVTWISVVVLILGIYYFGKKRADKRGDLGNTYGEAFGFTLVSMFYAGIITGLGSYFLNAHIAPEYFEKHWEFVTAQVESYFESSSQPIPDNFVEALDMGIELMRSPIAMVFSGVFDMMFNGGAVGLFISPFLKRSINPFIEKNEE